MQGRSEAVADARHALYEQVTRRFDESRISAGADAGLSNRQRQLLLLTSLEEVLRRADFVSLHPVLTPETFHLINAERLALMKPTAYLINTSRGGVIDEAALIEALRNGRLAGAGLDVFEVEPVAAENPLLGMPNVVLSPHIASYSEEGDARHQERIAELALQVVSGGLPERKVVVNKNLYDAVAAQLEPAAAR